MSTKPTLRPKITAAAPLPTPCNLVGAQVVRVRARGMSRPTALVKAADGTVYTLAKYSLDFLSGRPTREQLSAFCKLTGQRPVDFKNYIEAQEQAGLAAEKKRATERLRRDAERLGYRVTKVKA